MTLQNANEQSLIAHVVFRLGVGGMENGLVNLVNRLPKDRFRHAIICLTTSGRFAQRIDVDRCSVHELNKQEGKDPAVYFRLWKLLRDLRPDALHTRNLGTIDLAPLGRLAGVPVCVHGEHGWDAADPQGQSAKYRRLRRFCDRFITRYVAVSRDIAEWLSQLTKDSARRVTQIYNGVDTNRFSPKGPKAELPFRKNEDDPLVIGAVGRLDPIKNFDILIAAVDEVLKEQPALRSTLRLAIIGDGQMAESLGRQIQELGLDTITWLPGERDDIPELLRAMDIFVLPSRNEGISNTILEAMASGLPVVATNVGGNPELIDANDSGTLIRPNDAAELASAIRDYANDSSLRDRHGTAARKRVETMFSLDSMVRSYAELYDQLLSNTSAARIS